MKWAVAILLALVPTLSHANACVVEKDEVVVVGELSRETFAGPPNYESVTKGDKAETYWILTVRDPIPLCSLTDANGAPSTQGRLKRFQLLLNDDQRGVMQALIARGAWVRGRIVIAHTGHHHTGALIQVTELRPASPR